MSELVLREELGRSAGDRVFADVKLYNGEVELAQIDALIIFGDIAIVFEIKAKRITAPAKNGDSETLIDDLRKGIISAKDQLIKSKKIIMSREFDEARCESHSISLAKELLQLRHLVCVSVMTHEFPAYPLLVRTIMEKENTPDVLAISLFDVRLIATYLDNVFDFVYYLYVRSQIAEALLYETEAALLAYHLKVRLNLPDNVTAVLVDETFSQEIDADYPFRSRGTVGLSMQFGVRNVDSIIEELVSFGDPGMFRTFSMLRGMSGESAKDINRLLVQLAAKMAADNKAHDATAVFGKSALTFVMAPSPQAAMARVDLLRLKRDTEARFDEEHLLILSVWSRVGTGPRSRTEPRRRSRFRLRAVVFKRQHKAHSGMTVFPIGIPEGGWDTAPA